MIAKLMAGVAVSALVATFALAQGPTPAADLPGVNAGAPAPPARGADANLRRSLPTQAQWDASEGVKRYVAKAKEIAGGDPICSSISPPSASRRAVRRPATARPSASS